MNTQNLMFARETLAEPKGYWAKRAARCLSLYADAQWVEVVRSGRLSDATHRQRGAANADPGWIVLVASTGGKWGKNRREFFPRGHE